MGRGREEPETLVEQLEQQQRNLKIEKTMERGRLVGSPELSRSGGKIKLFARRNYEFM